MPLVEVTRTYLEFAGEPPAPAEWPPDARLDQVHHCPPSFFRYLYAEVGKEHRWTDRLKWTDAEIAAHLAAGRVYLWALYVGGAPAGYFELEREADGSVQIGYFGLLPQFIGRGLGRALLEQAILEARRLGTRVWLHTCTLDHPSALPNYLKRGFRPIGEEMYAVDVRHADETAEASRA